MTARSKTMSGRTCRILSQRRVCPAYHHLRLEAGDLLRSARPGQFVHLRIAEGLDPFLRRPFSIYRAQDSLDLLYEVVGRGTALLAAKRAGDEIDLLGPLGRPFALPPEGTRRVVIVAGGVGIAPCLFLSDVLAGLRMEEVVLLYGARDAARVLSFKAFRDNGCRVRIATEDGSRGRKGRVSVLFPEVLQDPSATFLYTCGPRPMMAAVQELAREHGISGEASCEETMACGLGACLGCAIPTTDGYRTVCYEGPTFDLAQVIF